MKIPVLPVESEDYAQGQMMGMLVVITMLENARDANVKIPARTISKIKRVAVENLANYLQKPEEDVILLIEEQLRDI